MGIIRVQLGFNEDLPDPDLPTAVAERVDSVLVQLDAVDDALSTAVLDSMAVKVGDLEVNYSQHIAELEHRGTRLLRHLSALTGLPIAYDRFSRYYQRRGAIYSIYSPTQ